MRSPAMAAYMRNHFTFLGIPTPQRRAAFKTVPKPEPKNVAAIARALWKREEREFHYVALDLLDTMAKNLDAAATLQLIEELTQRKSWWDSVDGLAGIASSLLRRNVQERGIVWAWSSHNSFWMNRVAILHQIGWAEETDKAILFTLCLAHAASEEFFVRKAIGWALRDYAWSNPTAVKKFTNENCNKLSA